MEGLAHHLGPPVYTATVLVGAIIAGLIAHKVLFRVAANISRRTSSIVDDSLVGHLRRPARVMIPLVIFYVTLQFEHVPSDVLRVIEKISLVLLILGASWVLVALTSVLEDFVLSKYRIADDENIRARKIYTQFKIIKKILIVAILVVGLAAVLLSFKKFRQVGAGLLASAGVAGIVLGVAARPALSNLLAGIQIALTEPIRLEDVVVVEGEWGRIEEITLTYVVVKIWDLRRLVVPIGYFLDKPFRNWTRQSSDLIGSVYLYADYTVPVPEVREELHRILQESSYWKGDVWALQVTDATEKTIQLRAIMDAGDSSNAWYLRCEVREKLIEFLRVKHPDALPKVRAGIANFTQSPSASGREQGI
ncbi:MAG: mechanosensitive ion channel family protein [Candidatus Sulfobium sp.]|jgi:small-conductance mechanosensitive channel